MDKNTIMALISTLNGIEVRGKANMDRLLGCIVTLEDALRELSESQEEA